MLRKLAGGSLQSFRDVLQLYIFVIYLVIVINLVSYHNIYVPNVKYLICG